MKKLKYKSFWDFLKKKPANLLAILIMWGLCIWFMIAMIIKTEETGSIAVTIIIIFLSVCLGYLGFDRVKRIYERVKDLEE